MYSTLRAIFRQEDTGYRDDLRLNACSEWRTGLVRTPLALACAFGLSTVLPSSVALIWLAATLAVEVVNRFATWRVVQGSDAAKPYFFVTSVAVACVWSAFGVVLWGEGSVEARGAAVAIFMLLGVYSCAFSHQSAALLAALLAPPMIARIVLSLSFVALGHPGPALTILQVVMASTVFLILAAAIAAHMNYAHMWEAREKLAEERDALEQRVAARTAELAAATDRAEAANLAKSHFLANMSHELRTPLNAVIGYAEMLDEDLEAEGKGELRKDAQRIRNSGRHLLKLVNDVLDLSKIEANRLDLDCEFCELGPMLREIQDGLRHAAEEKGNRIDVKLASDLGPAWADGLRLHQCVLNLASNACKFTENGLVSISAERFNDAAGAWIAIRVRDTGIGISSEQQSRLFRPFVQADVSTTRHFGGTGLGLSITRQLAQLMGGDVEMESVEGHGSTFTLILPHRTESQAGKTPSAIRAA